jgi:hypothetical protein
LSDKDLISEVNEYTPELLEEYNIDPDIYIWKTHKMPLCHP